MPGLSTFSKEELAERLVAQLKAESEYSKMARRLVDMIGHARFRSLSWNPKFRVFQLDHTTEQQLSDNHEPNIGRLSGGDLSNLLTTWESLCDHWAGDEHDGIG